MKATELPAAIDQMARAVDHELTAELRVAGDSTVEALELAAPRRTGRLAASFRSRVQGEAVLVESTAPYAAIVNEGGTVRGRLAVPLSAAAARTTPRGWSGGKLHPIGRPATVLATISKGRFEPRYALVSSVRIPGARYIERAETALVERAADDIATALEAAAGKALG